MFEKQNGPRKVNYIWVLAGGYLLYLAGKLIIEMVKGIAVMKIWKLLIALLFVVIGGYLCIREWKIYRYGSKEDFELEDELPDSYYNNIEDNFAEKYEKEQEE